MAVTGKTGADAIFKTMKRQAIVYQRYAPKLNALITVMQGLSLLTSGEAALAHAYVAAIVEMAVIFQKISDYSGF